MADTPGIAHLSDRRFLMLEGPDALSFLQGLVTNDVSQCTSQPILFTCMLTPQGKFFADFFIVPQGNGLLIDVHASFHAGLQAKLLQYKLRANITVTDVSDSWHAHACWGDVLPSFATALPDPRHASLGSRLYHRAANEEVTASLSDYHAHRIHQAVPDGAYDLTHEKSFPLEYDYDALHAIHFHKGCYVGQELTARTHFRGVIRKGIYRVHSSDSLTQGQTIESASGPMGTVLSCHAKEGLALLYHEMVEQQAPSASVQQTPVVVTRPQWAYQRGTHEN